MIRDVPTYMKLSRIDIIDIIGLYAVQEAVGRIIFTKFTFFLYTDNVLLPYEQYIYIYIYIYILYLRRIHLLFCVCRETAQIECKPPQC